MPFYSSLPVSGLQYIPHGSCLPAPAPTYLNAQTPSALTFEGHSSSPRQDAEMRYCRVLHETQAVGEVSEVHLILKRTWWAAILLEQAAPRERALHFRLKLTASSARMVC
jgi:hypothetical protein